MGDKSPNQQLARASLPSTPLLINGYSCPSFFLSASLRRGILTSKDVLAAQEVTGQCKALIIRWTEDVYSTWCDHHVTIAGIAKRFQVM